jgi:hypothetical protein
MIRRIIVLRDLADNENKKQRKVVERLLPVLEAGSSLLSFRKERIIIGVWG